MNQEHQPDTTQFNRLLLFFLCTVLATVITIISAMLMALGTGLASSPEEPVARVSQVLWAIGGLSFIPVAILLVILIGTHKRAVGISLSATVIAAGLLTLLGWLIDSGGNMPGTSGGDALVILVAIVPVIAGVLMIWQSGKLNH